MTEGRPVLGPDFPQRPEGIQRPLPREGRGRSRWRSRRPVELIVGPFYRAADLARRSTKRQAFLLLASLLVLGFLLTATWSLAGRLDPGHDPQWSRDADGRVGPVALSRDGRTLVAAVLTGETSSLQAFQAGGAGSPFARIAFHGEIERVVVDDVGARALVAVTPIDVTRPGTVGLAPEARGGPALYLVDLAAGTVLRADATTVLAIAASADLGVVALAEPLNRINVTLDGKPLLVRTLAEPLTAVGVSRDGSVVAFGSFDGELHVHHRPSSMNFSRNVTNHQVTSLALAADGSGLLAGFGASADQGGRALWIDAYAPGLPEAWALRTALPVAEVALDAAGARGVVRTIGGEPLLLGTRAEPGESWNVTLESTVERVALSDDGSTVAVAYTFRGVEARRAASGSPLWRYNDDRNESRIEATALAVSGDGSVIASNGRQAGDAEPVRLLVFDRDREGGLLGPLWTKVLVAGVLETALVVTVVVLWERARARKQQKAAANR